MFILLFAITQSISFATLHYKKYPLLPLVFSSVNVVGPSSEIVMELFMYRRQMRVVPIVSKPDTNLWFTVIHLSKGGQIRLSRPINNQHNWRTSARPPHPAGQIQRRSRDSHDANHIARAMLCNVMACHVNEQNMIILRCYSFYWLL